MIIISFLQQQKKKKSNFFLEAISTNARDSQRMEDWSGFGAARPSMSSSNNNDEFEEEEVLWNNNGHHVSSDDHQDRPKSHSAKSKTLSAISPSSSSSVTKTSPSKIPRRDAQASSKQVGNQSSSPMKIPDWSKIYGKTNGDDDDIINNNNNGYHDEDDDDNGGDGDEDDMVPPHEWIARKLARSQISSFSVCEGIGRTLKGRDLSKVRNAILTKTGFLE